MENFEGKVQAFWGDVQKQYLELVQEGGIAENTDFYVFQTGYRHKPDLMIVGINPAGGDDNGDRWLCPPNNFNNYTKCDDVWFQTLRKIFGYPDNENLKTYLDDCVGSNEVFINTGSQRKLRQLHTSVFGPTLIRQLVTKIIEPKHIVALGKDVFYALRTGKETFQKFGDVNFKYAHSSNGVPICFIPNPSKQNIKYFNNASLLKDWQNALEWFMKLE
jgi:hypothetical protein